MSYRNCINCANRRGTTAGKCLLSGVYISTERRYPTVCGVDFDRWQPRMGVLLRFKRWFTGEPQQPQNGMDVQK